MRRGTSRSYRRLVLRRGAALVATAALGALSAVGVSGCGGGGDTAALSTRLDETRLLLTLTIGSTTAEGTTSTRPTTPTATRTTPSPPTVTRTVATTTVSLTQSETTVVAPIASVTTVVTTTAVVAVAETTEQESTQWGWIAFGILAAAVIVAGIVLWRRSARQPPTA
jgi:hypothetical protein